MLLKTVKHTLLIFVVLCDISYALTHSILLAGDLTVLLIISIKSHKHYWCLDRKSFSTITISPDSSILKKTDSHFSTH